MARATHVVAVITGQLMGNREDGYMVQGQPQTPEFEHMAVMCLGNLLLGDEGLGPAVARRLLERYEFPSCVDVLDCGVMGFALMDEFERHDYILTVDAVCGTGEEPGTVFTFGPDDIAAPQGVRSAHDTRFADVLSACRLVGFEPVGECIGVQVAELDDTSPHIGLSPQLEAALPLVCETVLATLVRHGVRDIVDKDTGEKVAPR